MTMSKIHDHDDPRYAVKKSDAEWRAALDPMQYQVARHAATERAAYADHPPAWANQIEVSCSS